MGSLTDMELDWIENHFFFFFFLYGVFSSEKLGQFTASNQFPDLGLTSTTAVFAGITQHNHVWVCVFIFRDCKLTSSFLFLVWKRGSWLPRKVHPSLLPVGHSWLHLCFKGSLSLLLFCTSNKVKKTKNKIVWARPEETKSRNFEKDCSFSKPREAGDEQRAPKREEWALSVLVI